MLNTARIADKYRPAPPMVLPARRWPDQVIRKPPIWCAIDLRDGNQSLPVPMNAAQKRQLFRTLVTCGIREIEVGFPSASQPEFDFVRSLVQERAVADDVTLMVLAPARQEHIQRACAALHGARTAILHLYLSTNPAQRRLVFGLDRAGVIRMAVQGAKWAMEETARHPETQWTLQFSPESFSATEPEFALAVCEAVCEIWRPTPENKVILNLPATVEVATPNRYADQIEWFGDHLTCREAVMLSVHPHNDRGTAVAAAELALMAGAQRVEGALFGNGERTGNVDLITLALNLHTQGVDPGLRFADIDAVTREYERCTGMRVPPRHPYAGSLIFTAFSGSHQDAIRKGLAAWKETGGIWEVPYLPLDPADLGRSRETVIRVNSQSGKGGAAFVVERATGMTLPRALQVEFALLVQRACEASGRELIPEEVIDLFQATYQPPAAKAMLRKWRMREIAPGRTRMALRLLWRGADWKGEGEGNGPVDAAIRGMPGEWRLLHYEEHALTPDASARAAAFVELADSAGGRAFGVGCDANIVTASLLAILAAVHRIAP
ncbi:MAG: 2-isopropylmalate synthase [Magnetococcales bacterium]|nr:2-isopropylmalate synthase [Magnetococcales bacterium]